MCDIGLFGGAGCRSSGFGAIVYRHGDEQYALAVTIDIALNARGEAKSCKVIANSQREIDPCAQFPIGESLNAVPGMPASPVGGTVRITMTATYMPD